MNRFKKYIRTKGVKLEKDFPWLPYESGSITIESVIVNSEACTVHTVYNVGIGIQIFNRSGNFEFDFD